MSWRPHRLWGRRKSLRDFAGTAVLLVILAASGKPGHSWFAPLGVTPALGQTVNSGALDALNPARPAKPATPRPAPGPAKSRSDLREPAHPAAPARTSTAKPAASAKPPVVPTVPPAIAAIPPAVAVPVSRPPPVPAVPIADDAPGEATVIPGGIRVTFGPDRADLNPVTGPALRNFARSMKAEQATINVVATAAGSADDPSTPRRLSLSRALAARAVLITEGIASTRIYVRALGANGPPDGPPDRVDVSSSANASSPATGGPPPAATPAGAAP